MAVVVPALVPANYTRRHDLFADAGLSDPDAAIMSLLKAADSRGWTKPGMALAESLRLVVDFDHQLAPFVQSLLDLGVDWLTLRGGDLATMLWLAHSQAGEDLDLASFVFTFVLKLWESDHQREAAALMRFLVAVDFDYSDLYLEQGIAHAFFEAREPNPLVWKLLQHCKDRHGPALRILELGCGIGNDAIGFLSGTQTEAYTGVDLSQPALDSHKERFAAKDRPQAEHRLIQGDFVQSLKDHAGVDPGEVNVIYSYSSLHYFSSDEVKMIFNLVRRLLEPGIGLFCFAIKGKGSAWDGQGVPLYRPDVWINYDGQSRWFPSKSALTKLVDNYGFELRVHQWHEHWGYSELGKCDQFHYVICTPRA